MSFTLDASRGARQVSGEFDYMNLSGSTFYYGDSEGVSSSSKIGSVAVGSTLSRRSTSWIVSAGQSDVQQVVPTSETSLGFDVATQSELNTHAALTAATTAHGLAQAENIVAAEESHSINSTFSNTEEEDALDALGGTINTIIAALEAAGISAVAE